MFIFLLYVRFVEQTYQEHFFFLIEIIVRRKMLGMAPANNILIVQPSVKLKFSPSRCSHVVPFSLSLVEEKYLPNRKLLIDSEALVDEHLSENTKKKKKWHLHLSIVIKKTLGQNTPIDVDNVDSVCFLHF